MHEHLIILDDLQKYLDKAGLAMEVSRFSDTWAIARHFPEGGVGHHFSIFDGSICVWSSREPIISLADPKYREKFYKYLMGLGNRPMHDGQIKSEITLHILERSCDALWAKLGIKW